MKANAVWIDCPGITGEGRFAHDMRDYCTTCAPYWGRIPQCPEHGGKLSTSGYCKTCKRYYALEPTEEA